MCGNNNNISNLNNTPNTTFDLSPMSFLKQNNNNNCNINNNK